MITITIEALLTINATKAPVWTAHTDIGLFDPEGNKIELWEPKG